MRTSIFQPAIAAIAVGGVLLAGPVAGQDVAPAEEDRALEQEPEQEAREARQPQAPQGERPMPQPERRRPALSKQQLQQQARAHGYLKARRNVQRPLEILGGPITVHVRQDEGGVHVALPDRRRIDPRVFGTQEMPQAVFGTPIVTGLPPQMRGTRNGEWTVVQQMSPFGDKHLVMPNGKMHLQATDATATDAAKSDDKVTFEASWQDEEGNTYAVRCNEVIPAGVEYPVFGGVVTNHIVHGFSGVGTPLMPTEFAYVAFWGKGDVLKNGNVVDRGRIVHGMLTEYVRGENYRLVFDEEVTPTRRHFHLMVAPVKPDDQGNFTQAPVQTGLKMPNGQQLPFWHVMFANLKIQGGRGQAEQTEQAEPHEDREQEEAEAETDNDSQAEPAETVGMSNSLNFDPASITVQVGETVLWRNTSDVTHTVTADPGKANQPAQHVKLPQGAETFDSGSIQPGNTFRHTFTVPGNYKYFCIPHEAAGMTGTVQVRPRR